MRLRNLLIDHLPVIPKAILAIKKASIAICSPGNASAKKATAMHITEVINASIATINQHDSSCLISLVFNVGVLFCVMSHSLIGAPCVFFYTQYLGVWYSSTRLRPLVIAISSIIKQFQFRSTQTALQGLYILDSKRAKFALHSFRAILLLSNVDAYR